MEFIVVCKDADSMGEVDALTLIAILLMPLILQQQQLVYCCESCMCLVCVNDVCLKLFSLSMISSSSLACLPACLPACLSPSP